MKGGEKELKVLIEALIKVVDHLEKKVAESDEVDSKVYAEIDLDWVKSMITTLNDEPDFFRFVNFLTIYEKYKFIFWKKKKRPSLRLLKPSSAKVG